MVQYAQKNQQHITKSIKKKEKKEEYSKLLDLNEVDLRNLSPEDRKEAELLLIEEAEYQKYNTALKSFHQSAYPWQKHLVNLSKAGDDGTPIHRIIGAIAGNRTGKSYAICGIIASHLTGIYPGWWRGKRFKKPIKAYYCGYDSKFNKRTPQEYLFGSQNRRIKDEVGTGFIPKEVISDEGLVPGRDGGIASAQIRHKSGGWSSLEFHSYSMGAEAAQGFSAHVVVIDEQPPDEYFSEVVKRTMVTDQGPGLVYCGFTPLHGITPNIERFWNLPLDPDQSKNGFLVKTGKMIPVESLEKEENRGMERWAVINVGWDGVPHLTKQEMNETLAATPVYLHEAVRNGVPVGGHGRVYPHDSRVITYDPGNTLIKMDWEWLIGIDIGFGTRDPAAGILACWDKDNDTIYITDEFKDNVFTEQEMAQKIWGLDKDVPVAWPDDAGRKGFKGQGTVVSLLDDLDVNLLPEFFKNPPDLRGKNHKELAPGFAHLNSRFYSSRLKINKNCIMLLKEMENYQYKDGLTTQYTGEHHLCDAMRYCIMSLIQDYGAQRRSKRKAWDDIAWKDDDIWEEYGIYG